MGCSSSVATQTVTQTSVRPRTEGHSNQDIKAEISKAATGTSPTKGTKESAEVQNLCEKNPTKETVPVMSAQMEPKKQKAEQVNTPAGPVRLGQQSGSQSAEATEGKVAPSAKKKDMKLAAHTFEEDSALLPSVLTKLEETLPRLLELADYSTDACDDDLCYLRDTTRLHRQVRGAAVDRQVELGLVEVCLRAWRQLFSLEHTAFQIMKNMNSILVLMWNGTDISLKMCQEMTKTSMPEMLFENLAHPKLDLSIKPDKNISVPSDMNEEEKKQFAKNVKKDAVSYNLKVYITKGLLGISHNLIQKCDVRERFRKVQALDILQKLRKCEIENQMVLCKAEILLAYMVNEDENNIINSDDNNIKFIVSILKSAMKGEGHNSRSYGYSAGEVVAALNKLAVNDANKGSIIREGALKHYVKLLGSDCTEEEQTQAARGLWILSFTKEGKDAIKEQPGCLEALHKLETSSASADVKKAASGALWILEDREKLVKTGKVSQTPHVMISYQWSHKPIAIKIKDRLKSAGFHVWMDVENMSGSTLEAMAQAVEQAAVVLICMSQKYKESPSCRTEAEYTYRLQKDFIPVKMEYRYNPDGWLGIMIGVKLWFDFGKDDKFETTMENLIRELGTRGQLSGGQDVVDRSEVATTYASPQATGDGHGGHASWSKQSGVAQWTSKDVAKWLEQNDLESVKNKFADFDGSLIVEYQAMMSSAPEAFYNSLRADLKFPLITILKFTKALKALP